MSELKYPGRLDIYLLDDSSKDATPQIGEFFSAAYKNIHYIKVPEGFPKGKSRVLNYGASLSDSKYVCVYDADNQPEPYAVKLLVEAAEQNKKSCGAVGYVKTINFYKNILTRMIALEFSVFQMIMQCGRWQLFNLGTYTGTNMLVLRSALSEVGYWDVDAIAEDSDLSMSLSAKGYQCPVVPQSITWEQEPEKFSVWFKQRSRWMMGNMYIISKAFRTPEWRRGKVLVHTIQILTVYILFVGLLLLSHTLFILAILGQISMQGVYVPTLYLWYLSWFVYLIMLVSAQFLDGHTSIGNVLVSFAMYLTYAQVWVVLLLKSLINLIFNKNNKNTGPVWDKTVRF